MSRVAILGFVVVLVGVTPVAYVAHGAMPPVPEPAENPFSEEKRILGKILFWDEQLSTDDTVACGTCHIPANAGGDPRVALHPGADGKFGTDDDVVGSPGIVRLNEDGVAKKHGDFGYEPQVTGRAAQSYFGSMWGDDIFWDGRATSAFDDPVTSVNLIASGGALESQAVGPILSSVEMAKEGRTWDEVVEKLDRVAPLRLATDLPTDVAAAIAPTTTYGDLFLSAFGDAAITPARIAFAIATYERTLVPDESPWDLFDEGDTGALNAQQQQGLQVFINEQCDHCHTPPLFTDNEFHNIGLRPAAEDIGRQGVTGAGEEFGDFKTPSLRNIGLRVTLMHTGQIEDVADAINFYRDGPNHQHFEDDQDDIPDAQGNPNYNFNINPQDRNALRNFLENGLTDPRVAAETPPFDRPTLRSEAGNPELSCSPAPLAGCLEPTSVGQSPFVLKNSDNDNGDLVVWRFRKGPATTNLDFGNPVTVDPVTFCLYTGAGETLAFEAKAPSGESCNGKPCWKKLPTGNAGDKGYVYKDGNRASDGVLKVQLRPGEEEKTKLLFKAKGELLEGTPAGFPAIPIPLPVTAQLQTAAGQCFSTTYAVATKNDSGKFTTR